MALNNKQLKAIELLVYSPYKTQNMIAQEVGVHRDTIRRWREETPEFKEALEKATKERWKAAEQMAINSMINLASEGNFQAAKYICDSLGYKPVEKLEANVKSDVVLRIGYDEDEQVSE